LIQDKSPCRGGDARPRLVGLSLPDEGIVGADNLFGH
jgi:hypothetical protein